MKHKVSELVGGLLDAAVAKALGWPIEGQLAVQPVPYSTEWRYGGPIIEGERIGVLPDDARAGNWLAARCRWVDSGGDPSWEDVPQEGPTPLVAAMRGYVLSRFGNEVDLP